MSAERRAKISEAVRAAMSKPEVKAKLAKAKGRPSPRKGVHLSEETKAKLRAANLGKRRSADVKKKISEKLKSYWQCKKT